MLLMIFLLLGTTPKTLILINGTKIPLEQGVKITAHGLLYQDHYDRQILAPFRYVNFKRTFAPKKPAKKIIPKVIKQRQIPWQHPKFSDKQMSFSEVIVTNKSLMPYQEPKPKPKAPPEVPPKKGGMRKVEERAEEQEQ